jgi:hypothetical protein
MSQGWAGHNSVGSSDMDEQLVQLFLGANEWFGVDEQLVHFGVHLSQGPKQTFLRPSVH